MLTEQDIKNWIQESNVLNEFTHFDSEGPKTFITSFNEIKALIELAYDAGLKDGRLH